MHACTGLAAMEGRAIVRADRPDAGRVQRGGGHRALRQGGAAVRAGQRHGPAHHGRRDGDAGQQGCGGGGGGVAAGPETAAALLAQGQQQRRRVVGGADAVARHRVVQHQRPHHHHHPRGQVIHDRRINHVDRDPAGCCWDMRTVIMLRSIFLYGPDRSAFANRE